MKMQSWRGDVVGVRKHDYALIGDAKTSTVSFQSIRQSRVSRRFEVTKFHVCNASQARLANFFGECNFLYVFRVLEATK